MSQMDADEESLKSASIRAIRGLFLWYQVLSTEKFVRTIIPISVQFTF